MVLSFGNDAIFARMDVSEEGRLLEAIALRAQFGLSQIRARSSAHSRVNDYLKSAAKERREKSRTTGSNSRMGQ